MIKEWYYDWRFWLAIVTALAVIGQAVATWMIYRLENTIRKVDLGVVLGRGGYDEKGVETHDQDWIEVTNGSQTGIRVTEVEIKAARSDGVTREIGQAKTSVVKPFSTEKINIYSEMTAVVPPLCDKAENSSIKGRLTITLKYRAHGKSMSTEPWDFDGEIFHGRFLHY
jgi:hypothetical protein